MLIQAGQVRRLLAPMLAVSAALLVASPLASAAPLRNVRASGIQGTVGCLSSSLCVVGGYNNHSVGDILTVKNGAVTHVATVKGTNGVDWISCPGPSGCVAFAKPANDVGLELVTIGSSGKIRSVVRPHIPAAVSIHSIACSSLTRCVLAGQYAFATPEPIEVGSWNGHKISFHRVAPPHGDTDTSVEGVACSGGSCVVVGYALTHGATAGFVIAVHGGKPAGMRLAAGDSLYGVSCASAKTCYAAGFANNGGVVVTITGGRVKRTAGFPQDLSGIACHGSGCVADGEQLNPGPGAPDVGTITTLSNGSATGTQLITAVNGFNGPDTIAAERGGFFTAVGLSASASGPGSDITTG